jgi:hypothetical protein
LQLREEKGRPAHGDSDMDEGIKITRSNYTQYMDRKKDALQFDVKKREAAKDKANEAGDESSNEEEDGTDHEAPAHNLLDKISLLEWLRYYNFKTGTKRPRAKPRCIHYYPRY